MKTAEPQPTPNLKKQYSVNKLTIPSWSVADRPREKYISSGSRSVSDTELIAILLRCGTPDLSALDLAKKLLSLNNNSLNQLSQMSIHELTKINGIGKVKAITLHAAFELGRRRRAEPIVYKKKISQSQDIVDLLQSKLAELSHEEFWVIYLNQASCMIEMECISKGGWSQTAVDVRMIIKKAIDLQAPALILCHNHPSGNVKPSKEDMTITHNIISAAEFFNIKIMDHIILHRDVHYSFCSEGLL